MEMTTDDYSDLIKSFDILKWRHLTYSEKLMMVMIFITVMIYDIPDDIIWLYVQ